MVAHHKPLIIKTIQELQAGVQHLEYSYRKVQKIPLHKDQMDEEQLENCEGFVSRFARVSDLYLSKYLRTKVLIADPAFRGEILDLLNKAEKMGLIQIADDWYEIRTLRNFSVHEYTGDRLTNTLKRMLDLTPLLLESRHATE